MSTPPAPPTSSRDVITIQGARQHNLKNVSLQIPKHQLVVFTGVSGSGKSSLAFDTIYAEGQRRYVESLSSYARQFLGVMAKPDLDHIAGLSPAISIDQKTTSHNPRSTVGTITEIYDYLRLLFARVGHPHCPECGREIATQSVDQMVSLIFAQLASEASATPRRFLVLAPIVRDRKGEFSGLFESLMKKGYARCRIDGQLFDLHEDVTLIKTNKHTIEVVIDRLSATKQELKSEQLIKSLRWFIRKLQTLIFNVCDGHKSICQLQRFL
jgi:excinuclease ABC subunit A